MGEVINVKPKRVNGTYRGMDYMIEYNPNDETWSWCVYHRSVIRHPGTSKALHTARQMVERRINEILR